MTKTYIFCLVASAAAISCNNSTKKETSKTSTGSPEQQLMEKAMELHDYQTAIVAANQILLKDSTRTDLYDSLATYYIGMQNQYGAKKMVDKALVVDANNYKMLDYSGVFDQLEGKYPEAYNKFQRCYNAKGEAKFLYRMANVNIALKDMNKADSLINILLALPPQKTSQLEEVQTPGGGSQLVSYLALTYMMKANLVYTFNNRDLKTVNMYLDKAIEAQPDYQEALYYKQELKKSK